MKKLKFLMFAMAGCLAVTSCSDDDSGNNTPVNQNISGSYQLTSYNAPTAQDYDNDGDISSNLVLEGGCYNDSWISFHSDGTYNQNFRQTTTGNGGLTLDCNTQVTSGTYTRNGNSITTYATGSSAVSAVYTYNAVTGTLSGSQSNAAYTAWNSTASLWATVNGTLQVTYTKYTDNDQDNGATLDTDGENNDDNNANFWLIGNFNLSSYVVATAQNLDNDGDSSANLTSESSCYAQSHIIFHADGTYEEQSAVNVLSGGGLSLTCDTETTTGTWTRSGDTVTTHRTSSGSGSVNVNYTFDATTRTLVRSNNTGSYPAFSTATSLFSMVNGAVSYTYTRS
jgi:hypothetical protein